MRPRIRPLPAAAILLGLALAGFVPAQVAAQDDPVLYIVADVVKLRAGPSREAAVVANLRIDTPVRPVEGEAVPEGWAKVASVAGYETGPFVSGYMASAFLSELRPTAAVLLDRHQAQMAAGDLEAARTTAERLVALEPAELEHVERLRALYARLGDQEGVQRLTDYLQGDGVKFIAYCGNNYERAMVLAEYRPGEGLESWVSDGSPPITERLTALRQSLQRSPWFASSDYPRGGGGDPIAMQGTWLLNARLLPPPDPDATGRFDSEKLLAEGCARGAVYSNESLRLVESGPLDWPRMADVIQAGVLQAKVYQGSIRAIRGRQILDGAGLASVEIEIDEITDTWHSRRGFAWGLFDGESVEPLAWVGNWIPEYNQTAVWRVTWFKWDSAPERVAIVEYSRSTDGGGAGTDIMVVVVDEEGNVLRLLLPIDFLRIL